MGITSVLFPEGGYAKKGDAVVRKEIEGAVNGRRFDLRPVARGPDIADEGEVYWISFENEDIRITKDLAS